MIYREFILIILIILNLENYILSFKNWIVKLVLYNILELI